MTTPTDVNAYLSVVEKRDPHHWSWRYHEKQRYWHIEYTEVIPPCKMNLELDDQFLYIHSDIGEFRVRPECRLAMHYFLLRLNDALPIVKFGLGDDGKISLMAEALAGQINLGVFETLIQLVVAVFDQYHREIELLASDRELADLVLRPLETSDKRLASIKVLDR